MWDVDTWYPVRLPSRCIYRRRCALDTPEPIWHPRWQRGVGHNNNHQHLSPKVGTLCRLKHEAFPRMWYRKLVPFTTVLKATSYTEIPRHIFPIVALLSSSASKISCSVTSMHLYLAKKWLPFHVFYLNSSEGTSSFRKKCYRGKGVVTVVNGRVFLNLVKDVSRS